MHFNSTDLPVPEPPITTTRFAPPDIKIHAPEDP